MFSATVNNNVYKVQPDTGGFIVNEVALDWDVTTINEGYFHIIYNNKSFRAEVVKADYNAKAFHIKVNGSIHAVSVKDKFDILLEKMGMSSNASTKVNSIKSPMPGLIVNLKVKAGEEVKKGDVLLILEAMKMENIIKSPGDGIIKSIHIKKGDSVEKNQVLIEF